MAKGVNKVILVGRVGRSPELSNGSTKYARFSLATGEKYKDKAGQWVEKTEWHSLVAFGALSDIVSQYIIKGSQVYIEGKLQTSSWEQDGEKKYKVDVLVNNIVLLGEAKDNKEAKPKDQPVQPMTPPFEDDDIPF